MRFLRRLALLFLTLPTFAGAATTVPLPGWACDANQSVFRSGFQDGERIPSDPSQGSGGVAPGKTYRTLHLAGLAGGTQNYYVFTPSDYTPTRPWPLLLALHGSGAYGSQETNAATTRDNWSSMAQSRHFLVAAPVASAEVLSGGVDYSTWLVPPVAGLSDYDLLAAVVADMEGAYNVDRARLYGWGFSAGAHVMHDLMLGSYSPAGVNANTFAAYGVSAGGLQQLVCGGVGDAACSTFLSGVARKIPLDIHLGSADPLYLNYGAGDDPTILANAGWVAGQNLFYTLMSGTGHSYDGNQLAHIWINICPFAVEP